LWTCGGRGTTRHRGSGSGSAGRFCSIRRRECSWCVGSLVGRWGA
jgi:hypothetical protein